MWDPHWQNTNLHKNKVRLHKLGPKQLSGKEQLKGAIGGIISTVSLGSNQQKEKDHTEYPGYLVETTGGSYLSSRLEIALE